MAKTRELSLPERNQIIGMFRANMKKVAIAKEMGLGESTVRYVISKWLKSESVNSVPRSGRPSKLSERDARRLIKTSKKHRKATLNEIGDLLDADVSTRTLQRKLLVSGIRSRLAVKKLWWPGSV